MSNISCNVIRDLLPSYMDKLASEDSVRLVEEHLADCKECRALKDRMEKPTFAIADNDVGLDYMKKIRKLVDLRSAVCFLLVLITGVFYLEFTKDLHQSKPFFVLVAVMLVCNYLLFFCNSKTGVIVRAKNVISNVISFVFALYIIFIMQLSIYNWLNDKNAPFSIDYADLGPFLYSQLMLVLVVELVVWLRGLVLHMRKAQLSVVSSSFAIIGFYMSLYYARMLKLLETLDSFRMINRNALLLFAEGIGILAVVVVIERIKDRNRR